MTTKPSSFVHRLRRGQVQRYERARRLCLRAERGSLWVTVDGERDDIQLDPGMSHVLDTRRLVLVSALGGDAVFSATPLAAAAPAWWRRLQHWRVAVA